MADFTFLFNRKGALYPIDYENTSGISNGISPSNALSSSLMTNSYSANSNVNSNSSEDDDGCWPYDNKNKISSLVYLCCKVIVSDSTVTDQVTNIIPSELFVPLFRAALYPVKDAAIDVIINKWPFKSLILKTYTKTMFSSFLLLYNELEMCQRTRLGVKYSADVVHSFIEALRKRQTKLRYLDLTGFPIAEIIIKYVATHCRLAQKEYQRNCLIDEYFQNVSDLEQLSEKPTAVRNDLRKTTSLPDEQRTFKTFYLTHSILNLTINFILFLQKFDWPVVFRFDCILQERSTFEELMGALNASTNNRFQLQIIKLDLLCLGKGNIIKLLDKLDKNVSIEFVADTTASLFLLATLFNLILLLLVYRRHSVAIQFNK